MAQPPRLLTVAATLALAACSGLPSLTPARAPTPPPVATNAAASPSTAAPPSALPASSPAAAATPRCAPGEQAMVNDTLYFGTSIPKGNKSEGGAGTVSPAAWQTFMDSVVTPRFPQGLSIWRAAGQWRGENGTVVREPSYVLQLVYPQDAATDASVVELMARYKTQFRQEAVLRVRTPACVSF